MHYDSNSVTTNASSSEDKKNDDDHPLLAAEKLALTAAMGWNKSYGNRYRDDITIVFTDMSNSTAR